jgi:SagB-type dehydrogenase family enzyme
MQFVDHALFCSFMQVLFAMVLPVMTHAGDLPSKTIKLPQPAYDSKTSIERALLERRSIRKYNNLPISLSDVSQLLWAAQGLSGARGLRTAPSAGALFPLEIAVVAGNVNDLAPGIYLYKPEGHGLRKIVDNDKRKELSRAALGQSAITNAAAVLVISAVYERTTIKYGERGVRYVHMEAGHAAENVFLQAVSLNLGTVVIGAFDDSGVKKVVNLTGGEQPLYLMPIGRLSD